MTALSRRHFLASAGGGLAALSLPRLALPHLVAAQEMTKASLQMGWIANVENAGEFVAAEKGYYTAEGLDMTLEPGGPADNAGVRRGEPRGDYTRALPGEGAAEPGPAACPRGSTMRTS